MLETRNLCKTYKPKKGVPVTAVDHVSLRFPEKGMVFLLGKSGSGKSTMLNLLGGLDSYDDGEIIIKGISSKDFNQQRFDSYRNTYVGFIFQEYNVLEEFTVGANIALALELQGRTATDEELNSILHAVDLEGYGARKPNELSGGQKQRVAIARALVKNPEIIMADEPTGALDSNTGRQVLDTLKKLSEEKLVIIVSHDREYAEAYADRIIELADGKVIRDVEAKQTEDGGQEKQIVFRSTSIEIPLDYHLTEEDRIQINEYLDKIRSGASLMLPSTAQRFSETDESCIPVQDGSKFSLIKSKLPMKSAFKIGCSSLKHKRFRLVMTIFLSVIAFTLFSLVDTFSSYDHVRTCTDSLIDSKINYISVNQTVKRGSGIDEYWTTAGLKFSEEEMKKLTEETGVQLTGLFIPHDANLTFISQFDTKKTKNEKSSYTTNLRHFCGFAEITEQSLADAGCELVAGKLPDGSKAEIAISKAAAESFVKGGYHKPLTAEEQMQYDYDYDEYDGYMPRTGMKEEETEKESKIQYEKISSASDMVGKVIRLMDTDYTVTGIVDTFFDLTRYDRLSEDAEHQTTSEQVINYMLYSEYNTAVNYSLTGCVMVGSGAVAKLVEADPDIYDMRGNASCNLSGGTESAWLNVWTNEVTKLRRVPDSEIIWLNGKKDSLSEKQFIIPLNRLDIQDDKASLKLAELMSGEQEISAAELRGIFDQFDISAYWGIYGSGDEDESHDIPGAEIVGVIKPDSPYGSALVCADEIVEKVVMDFEGVYDSAIGGMPKSRSQIEKFVRTCYREGEDVTERYELNNPVTYELDTVNTAVKVLARVFFWIGLFFAFFAALLMANFISTSIHYKRQEIGILRAIGSRSNDVFRIFFSESFVIAMINFVLSAAACGGIVWLINYLLRREAGILITVLHFGVRQLLLLFVISVGIAAIASFLPVHRIAAKKPIDAIRDK
ncbi:MAG: ATP-binding cassette domain-containing protein [Oscillospiraceae bacterium]|nr:ATP-binding cassette domain-containing protein [Oscillospiraceae bacterium]